MTFLIGLLFILPLWGLYMTRKLIKQEKKLDNWANRIRQKSLLLSKIMIHIQQVSDGKEEETKKGQGK